MDSEAIEALQFLVNDLFQQLQFAALRNRAYEKLAPELAQQASFLLTTPEFVELIRKSSEMRHRVIEAVACENWTETSLALAAMIEVLKPH